MVFSAHYKVIVAGMFVSLNYTQSNGTLSLKCISTGFPPTTVTWSKDGVEMSSGNNYSFSQIVADVDSSTYENTLVTAVDSESDKLGLYQCNVQCYDDAGELISNESVTVSVTGKIGEY